MTQAFILFIYLFIFFYFNPLWASTYTSQAAVKLFTIEQDWDHLINHCYSHFGFWFGWKISFQQYVNEAELPHNSCKHVFAAVAICSWRPPNKRYFQENVQFLIGNVSNQSQPNREIICWLVGGLNDFTINIIPKIHISCAPTNSVAVFVMYEPI